MYLGVYDTILYIPFYTIFLSLALYIEYYPMTLNILITWFLLAKYYTFWYK